MDGIGPTRGLGNLLDGSRCEAARAARHGPRRFPQRSPTEVPSSEGGVCRVAAIIRRFRPWSSALSFVERHGLWSREQNEAASRLRRIVEEQKLEVIRLSFPDQHGILRGKTLVASEALASLESGCSITTTMLAKDTSHRTVFPVFTRRRRLRHAGDGGRGRCPDGGRSRELSRVCHGRRPPAGCCATSISPTVGRCRSRPAHLYRSVLATARTSAATTSSRGLKSSSISSSSTTPECRPRMPASPGSRPLSACCRTATNI